MSQLIDVIADAETYYDTETYTLRKMATSSYVRDPRFTVHGWAVQILVGGAPVSQVMWQTEGEFRALLGKLPPERTRISGHNLIFDGLIIKERYGFDPVFWLDTLGMARALIGGRLKSHSLDAVSTYLGHPGKKNTGALASLNGVQHISRAEFENLGIYANGDVDATRHVLSRLLPRMTPVELWMMDWALRMFIDSQLELDTEKLREIHATEVARKDEYFRSLPWPKSDLTSNAKFAALLESYNVVVPTKISKTTGKPLPALGVSDLDFQALYDDYPHLKDLLDARVSAKSNIEETRAKKFHEVSLTGKWCVPLQYAGAMQTLRLSGGQGQNPQNLGRGSPLRKAIRAPKGYVVVVVDSSNIELRTSAAMAGQWDIMDRLVAGKDEYCYMASGIYKMEVDKKLHPEKRQVGKVAVLSLGYQAGANTFQGMLKAMAKVLMDLDQCQEIVDGYRQTYKHFPYMWREMDRRVGMLARGIVPPNLVTQPPVEWFYNSADHCGFRSLFSGAEVTYPNVRFKEIDLGDGPKEAMVYDNKRRTSGWATIYGGKCIAAGTEVLTESGWTPIELITTQRVWDGEAWVQHNGLAYKGVRPVTECYGISMTPDHKVLTTAGWHEARTAQAEGLHRASVRLPDGRERRGNHRSEAPLVVPVPLRQRGNPVADGGCQEPEEALHPKLRMPAGAGVQDARHDTERPHVRGERGAIVRPEACDPVLENKELARGAMVYDLVNCGPRSRFVARGTDGPVIVHNCTENMSQFLAREILNYQTLEIYKQTGLRPKLQVHDELVYCVPVADGEAMLQTVLQHMKGPVPWWPGIVTNAEGDVNEIYGEAK